MKVKQTNLLMLGIPIFIQLLLFNLLSTVDTLMVSNYNEEYVISMNNASSIIHMLNVLLNICSVGVGIVISQYLGAKKEEDATKAFTIGIVFNVGLSLFLLLFLLIFQRQLLTLINCPQKNINDAIKYISIVALGMPLNAAANIYATNLRSNKKPYIITLVVLCSNLLNVFLNWVLIYGVGIFPELGIQGAAIATICSQALTLVLAILLTPIILKKKIYDKQLSLPHLWQVLKIGLPSALESFCYTISSLFVTAAVNKLTKAEMLARTYINMILLYVYQFSIAFGQANSILVGHNIGERNYKQAKERTFSSWLICFPILMILIILLNLFGKDIIYLIVKDFDDSDQIIKFATLVLPWMFIYEAGRSVNLIFINSLKASGDVIFPLISAIFSMFIFSSLGSWVLGIWCHLGFLGIFIAQALDELARAVVMVIRWQSDKWQNRGIIKK